MAVRASKKMKGGFMCHSAASTAVCNVSDPRSVIVPRRPNNMVNNVDHSRLLLKKAISTTTTTTSKYSRHAKSSSSPLYLPSNNNNNNNNAVIYKSIKKDEENNRPPPPPLQKKKPPLSLLASSSSSDQVFQVVVMRVSLHCQGCAGKVKKHLSKMEGVTSFSIDLETKRVTVMGHVSPVGVLESISKVKKAEFWPCS